ncbi:glycosyltransferase [Hydrogenophaga sp. XSHU_21]
MKHVDIGLFAHNEAANIEKTLTGFLNQVVGDLDVRLVVLANGCKDSTAEVAEAFSMSEAAQSAQIRITIEELELGGKSRTWNQFVHSLSRENADVLIFSDADIELTEPDTLRKLVDGLAADSALYAFNSHPIKDIVYRPENLTWLDKLIARSSETLNDWKTAICGQLYCMPAQRAREFFMPIGLAVEDGFLRAMILTDNMVTEENMKRINGGEVFHVFNSERSINSLIKHQTRIVIGSAVNAAIFARLRSLPEQERHRELVRAAKDEAWLSSTIKTQLPRWPFGWIPLHFLIKRTAFMLERPRNLLNPRKAVLLAAGFGFDLIVYLNAQIKMARGMGAGYW